MRNEEKSFSKTSINCEKPIYRNTYSNHWKYLNFDIEIFTYFDYKQILETEEYLLWIIA